MKEAGFRQATMSTVKRVWTAQSSNWFLKYLPGLSPGLSFIFDNLNPENIAAFGKAFADQFEHGQVGMEGEAHITLGVK